MFRPDFSLYGLRIHDKKDKNTTSKKMLRLAKLRGYISEHDCMLWTKTSISGRQLCYLCNLCIKLCTYVINKPLVYVL